MQGCNRIPTVLAITIVVASIVVSCRGHLKEAQDISLKDVPLQTVDEMFAVQTNNGRIVMRMEAPIMEHFDNDTISEDRFSRGIEVYGYSDEGLLESIIIANKASHITRKKTKDEKWAAFGNVFIHNVTNRQTMETDTIYWDQNTKEIYTDCYVKMYSPDGFMQGIGMRSDDHARNAILHNPFNAYGYTVQDTCSVRIDSVNFIGAFPKK